MANKQVWFGTAEYMTWIPAPLANAGIGSSKWRASATYLNGGASQRASTTSHRTYSLAWSAQEQSEIQTILAFFDGVYGNGPFYYSDPLAEDQNVLPAWLAAPGLMGGDAPTFGGSARYQAIATGVSTAGYPAKSLQLDVSPAQGPYRSFVVAVPPGYNLRIGAHGSRTGTAAVTVRGAVSGSTTSLTMLNTVTDVRTNATFTGGQNYLISVGGTGILTLAGIIAQVLPVGTTVLPGNFIPGRGHSGLSLSADPTVTAYSAAIKHASIGLSAEFVETGAWDN